MPVHETTIQRSVKVVDLTELSDSENEKPAQPAAFAPSTSAKPSNIISELTLLPVPIKLEKPTPSPFKFNPFSRQIMQIRTQDDIRVAFTPRTNQSETFNIVFDQKFFALNTSADKQLNTVRDCIVRQDDRKLARTAPYFYKLRKELHVQGDCLFRGSRLVVPSNLTRAILMRAHEDHAGAVAMKDRCGHLWWPNMNHQIQTLSTGCKMCSYTGKNLKFLKPRTDVGTPRQPNHTNDILELDFCGPLRSHYRNKHYILVAIDRFSKFVTAKIVDALPPTTPLNS